MDCIMAAVKVFSGMGIICVTLYGIRHYLSTISYMYRPYLLVGKVAKIHCYPVASCKGMVNSKAFCSEAGLRMLGISNCEFIVTKEAGQEYAINSPNGTMKEYFCEAMRDISVGCDGKTVYFSKDNQHFQMNFKTKSKQKARQVYRGRDIILAEDLGDEVSEWFSNVIGTEVRLHRCQKNVLSTTMGRQNLGSCTIHTEESIAYLRQWVEKSHELKAAYFRPNILIAGCDPFDEQRWTNLKIGNVYFSVKCPDVRVCTQSSDFNFPDCKPTMEERSEVSEALCVDGFAFSTTLGVNAVALTTGEICVGDPVYAFKEILLSSGQTL
ncbi:mitochondrial amidoxime reducing component 2-like [Physella acuta]|uniref:mitochondrial amidoxime reducing component 2-like n=1 Tax=Physella acuta TaxID=109671 RepID=UPI0027DE96E0|nr:mitochondrial amidoxime reducing component 2-like [Physella acuta]